ncbi:MAG: NADH-quinone oxidoreductase subunit J [Myxococcota bacterium]
MPSTEILLFALFAVSAVVSALGVVAIRNPVKAAMSLIACFFCLACLFLLQQAEMIAILEVLVYAGAIMVLFVFVIMLVEDKEQPILTPALAQRITVPIKIIGVVLVAYSMLSVVRRSNIALMGERTSYSDELPEAFGTVAHVGRELFDNFLFHFEMTSVLLLVGIVGAVIVSKRGKSAPRNDTNV